MTIKQFAEAQGISAQAVYKKIKERKLNINQLKDEDGKELSQEGISILANLFGNERKKVEEKDNDFQSKIQHLEEENAFLKAELEKVKTRPPFFLARLNRQKRCFPSLFGSAFFRGGVSCFGASTFHFVAHERLIHKKKSV